MTVKAAGLLPHGRPLNPPSSWKEPKYETHTDFCLRPASCPVCPGGQFRIGPPGYGQRGRFLPGAGNSRISGSPLPHVEAEPALGGVGRRSDTFQAVFLRRILHARLRREDGRSASQPELLAILEKRLACGSCGPVIHCVRIVPAAL